MLLFCDSCTYLWYPRPRQEVAQARRVSNVVVLPRCRVLTYLVFTHVPHVTQACAQTCTCAHAEVHKRTTMSTST